MSRHYFRQSITPQIFVLSCTPASKIIKINASKVFLVLSILDPSSKILRFNKK